MIRTFSRASKPSFLQSGKDAEFEVVELKERKLVPPDAPEEPPPLAPPLKKANNVRTPQERVS